MRIAFAGVSHWHVPLYFPGIPEGSIVGMSDDSLEIAAQRAKLYGCPVYNDYKTLVRETKPDFVFAFAPHYMMKQMAEWLIHAGIPFSIEKPASVNSSEVEELYNLAEQKHNFVSIPFVWRYSDTVNDLKNKYIKKSLVHMSYRFIAGPPSRYLATSRWMLSRKTAGGGCMTNLGVHFIDMAMYLNDATTADVLASSYKYASPYDIETYATSLLEMPSGASLLLETGYQYPMSEGLQRENRWTIVSENGYFILAENKLELREEGKDPRVIPLNTDSDVYYPIYAKTTLSDYKNGIRPRASLKEMLDTRRVLDAMDAAAAKK